MNISIVRHLIRAVFNEDYQHTFSSSQREQCVLVDCCEWYSPAVGHWFILHPARDVITLSHPARGKPCGLLWIVLSSRKSLICLSSRQRFYYTFSPSRKEWFHPSGLLWLVLFDHQALIHISSSQPVQMVESSVFQVSSNSVRQVSLKKQLNFLINIMTCIHSSLTEIGKNKVCLIREGFKNIYFHGNINFI